MTRFFAVVLLLTPGAFAPAAAPEPKAVAFFENKIRPVLVQHCYSCHSTEAAANKKLRGGLFLDSRPGWQKGGDSGPSIVPGKPTESLLLKALHHGEMKMPPKEKLPDTVIADFERWIAQGAVDPRDQVGTPAKRTIDIEEGKKHWAFQPISIPPVGATIDSLIRQRLTEKKLALNPEAGRATLLRRVTFDLTGLPPTPEELDAFLKDTTSQAYEKVVDRLLASERYGERWARHWLDVVRFAESSGYEFDKDRPGAYLYRDFVIRSLNADMPYNEFVRLQLAGDRLKPGDLEAAAATGFLVAGPFPGQITQKTAQIIRYDHLDDMIATTGQAFLGLTLGCARCHDHKYDPLPQADYTHLIACLARTDSVEAKIDPDPEGTKSAKAAFDTAHGPLVAARDRFIQEELAARLQGWYAMHELETALPWRTLDRTASKGDASKPATTHTLTFHTDSRKIRSLRLEIPAGPFVLTDFNVTAAPLTPQKKAARPGPVKLRAGLATSEKMGHPLSGAVGADKNGGWSPADADRKPAVSFDVEGDLGFEGGTMLTIVLKFEKAIALEQIHLALSTDETPVALDALAESQHEAELFELLADGGNPLDPKRITSIVRHFRPLDADTERLHRAVEEHAEKEPKPKLVTVFSATGERGGDVHYLIRGEVERRNGVAKPGFLQVLSTTPDGAKTWLPEANADPRIGLGNWLTDVDRGAGKLLARVLANRLWLHHFGSGIVRTPNDFGSQGEPPTHPEVLDLLAGDLIQGGWKIKPLHRKIVLSEVYRQSGATHARGIEADPQNLLWWRKPPRRLEAEAVRDSLLAISGTLDGTLFGPGTLDENNPRRSVYLTVKRSRLTPFLQTFDAPEPVLSVGQRNTTTVPPQALALMNSPFVRQRAEKLAALVKPKSESELPQAIDHAYRQALSRPATESEQQRLADFVRERMVGEAKTLDAALADACQVLFCLNEFLYID